MKAVLLLCVVVATCLAQTTHKPHVTREPSVHMNMLFVYRPQTHSILLRVNGVRCYVSHLTAPEQMSVHTDAGMRAIEQKMIASLFTAVKVDPATLDQHDARSCGHATGNRTITYYKL